MNRMMNRAGYMQKSHDFRGGVRFWALLTLVSCVIPLASAAEDYKLAAGESATISGPAKYGTMTIDGDLAVAGGDTVSVSNINMTGGSITISGTGTTLGKSHGNATETFRTMLSMTNGADGAYGRIYVKGSNGASKGLATTGFYLRKEGEDFVSDNGYFDFLSLENGTANFFAAYNYSSCTGRITVTGTSSIYKRQPRTQVAIFRSGAFKIDLVDDAMLTFAFSEQGGYLNDCVVEVGGKGKLRFSGTYKTAGYSLSINKGALLNHEGDVEFIRASGTENCYFCINAGDAIGPNVTALKQTSGSSLYNTEIKIKTGEVATLCGDVEITGTLAYLTGGKIRIDTTETERSFKCNIKSGDTLVVEKVGENEMVVSATTNIPNLVVSEGAVRFAGNDCVVSNLAVSTGTQLIADGCTVTIQSDAEFVGASFITENGGRFVKSGQSRTMVYDPVSVTGGLHVASGELVFSKYGFDQKWWRWTFFSTRGGCYALRLRGIYMFGTDGTWQNTGLSDASVATELTDTVLAENKCRFVINSATNIVVGADVESRNKLDTLHRWFTLKSSYGGNHYPMLTSPEINPEDPTSWVGVEMHINSASKPITGYNMRVATWREHYADGWKVEASHDGRTWKLIDVRENQISKASANYYSYDNTAWNATVFNLKELFHFTGYRNGGLEVMDPLSVQVDDGAMLDLLAFDAGQPIDAVTIDLALGAGTVKGGRILANGTLTLVNVEESGTDLDSVLPILFDGTVDTDNFASWTVVVDGRKIRRKISYSDGRITVPPSGLVIMVK